jgi:phosphohistidine swiveling domain-containing protein
VRHHNVPLAPGSVVVTSMILPAHFTMLEMDKVAAIVAEHGGSTSHGAIFARTLEIPAVTGVEGAMRLARPGENAIVDGTSGRIYLAPDDALLAEYRRAQQRFAIVAEHLDGLRLRPAETRDGRRVVLSANVGLLADLRLVERHGAEASGCSAPSCWRSPPRGAARANGDPLRARGARWRRGRDDPHARSRRRQGGAESRARSRGESAARLPLGAPHDAPRRADARAAPRDPACQRRWQRAAAAADDLVAGRAARGEAAAGGDPGDGTARPPDERSLVGS